VRGCGVKVLTVRQPYASDIASGVKTVELRSRATHYRGPLAIHSSAKPDKGLEAYCEGLPLGQVICVVTVVGCRVALCDDAQAACLPNGESVQAGTYAWEIADPRLVKPLPRRGKLNLWNLPDAEIEYL